MKQITKEFLTNYKPSVEIKLPKNDSFNLPTKIIQFGEGRFIRAFLNFFIEIANSHQLFNGRSIVIQPRKADKADLLNAQDGLFTVCSRGLRNGKQQQEFIIVSSIKEALAAKTDWVKVLQLAETPSIEMIASNTTEEGLSYDPTDALDKNPPTSFPGKLTALLLHRFRFFNGDKKRGFMIFPLELVENNGAILKNLVLKIAKNWNLPDSFIRWLNAANTFYKCIVDRIVTGFPKPEELARFQQDLGYEDKFFTLAELYHSWIIEADASLSSRLPFDKAGLNVQFVSNIQNYFLRKVRILNGAHTSMVPIAYLSGRNLVKESIEDPLIDVFIQNALEKEVIPFVGLPKEELLDYKDTIIERFRNPFLEHKLLSISLYSSSKMQLRVLPSILAYYNEYKILPNLLPFAFAAFIVFMHIREKSNSTWYGLRDKEQFEYNDNTESLEFFYNIWKSTDLSNKDAVTALIKKVCQNTDLWGQDLTQLPQFVPIVANHVTHILTNGMYSTLEQILKKNKLIG